MLRMGMALTIGTVVGIFQVTAAAQCTKDTECKGDRICQGGVCVDPTPSISPAEAAPSNLEPAPLSAEPAQSPPEAAPAPSPEAATALAASPAPVPSVRPASTGWSLGASIIGLVGAGGVVGLSIGSAIATGKAHDLYDSDDCDVMGECDAAEDKEAASWAMGVPAIITVASLGPVVFFGGRSARHHPAVNGSLGLRITGIATYGASLSCAGAMVAVGIAEDRVPPALIGVTGGVGAVSLIALSIDALISRQEAEDQSSTVASNELKIFPLLAPQITQRGDTRALVGIGGFF